MGSMSFIIHWKISLFSLQMGFDIILYSQKVFCALTGFMFAFVIVTTKRLALSSSHFSFIFQNGSLCFWHFGVRQTKQKYSATEGVCLFPLQKNPWGISVGLSNRAAQFVVCSSKVIYLSMKTRFLPNNMHIIHFSGQLGDFYSCIFFFFFFYLWKVAAV